MIVNTHVVRWWRSRQISQWWSPSRWRRRWRLWRSLARWRWRRGSTPTHCPHRWRRWVAEFTVLNAYIILQCKSIEPMEYQSSRSYPWHWLLHGQGSSALRTWANCCRRSSLTEALGWSWRRVARTMTRLRRGRWLGGGVNRSCWFCARAVAQRTWTWHTGFVIWRRRRRLV